MCRFPSEIQCRPVSNAPDLENNKDTNPEGCYFNNGILYRCEQNVGGDDRPCEDFEVMGKCAPGKTDDRPITIKRINVSFELLIGYLYSFIDTME